MTTKKKQIKFQSASVKFLQKTPSALRQICCFQFINDCLQVFYKVKAGAFRTKNISKREWILDGESVLYANCDMINMCMLDIIKK